METVTVPVTLPKETYELCEGLFTFCAALKPHLKDGIQIGDTGAIIAAAISLIPSLKGLEKIPAEGAEDPGATAMAGAYLVSKLVRLIKA